MFTQTKTTPSKIQHSNALGGQRSASGGAQIPVPANATVQEFSVRLSKAHKRMHNVMSFNATLKVDFAKWEHVRMERENNMREMRVEEEQPKFGAGSEYMREQKEELRRKKYGIIAKKYKQEAQPWMLKVGGKGGKKFRGTREGGITEYASYYVFAHAPDGAIEAYPLREWYNFQPSQRYKALSAEQAEEEFARRRINLSTLMSKARLKGQEENTEDPEEKVKTTGGKKKAELRINDLDDVMMDSEDDSGSSGDEKAKGANSDDDSTKKKGKKPAPKKKKKKDSDDEAFEESDDGDEEGREMDYIESSDDDDSDIEDQANKEMKSVAEEDGLRTILNSDSSDDEEEKNSSDESSKEEEKKKEEKKKEDKKKEDKKKDDRKKDKESKDKEAAKEAKSKKSAKKPEVIDNTKKETFSECSSDTDMSESDSKSSNKLFGSRPATPSNDGSKSGASSKRKAVADQFIDLDLDSDDNSMPAKRPKHENATSFSGILVNREDSNGITEEAVRRYLMRKPMTTTELLTKFKKMKTGVSSDKLVETMTQILKKINPIKQIIQQKMYLSINPNAIRK